MDELFPDYENTWQRECHAMPEFAQVDESCSQQIIVSFVCYDDVKEFGKLLEQKVTPNTKSLWYPTMEREAPKNYLYLDES